jgi:hypothetical protein
MPPLMSPAISRVGSSGQYPSERSSARSISTKIDKQIFKQRLAKMTAGEFDLVAWVGTGLRRSTDVRRPVLVVEQEQSRHVSNPT